MTYHIKVDATLSAETPQEALMLVGGAVMFHDPENHQVATSGYGDLAGSIVVTDVESVSQKPEAANEVE